MCEVHTKLAEKSQNCIQQRRPLVRKPASRAADIKQYNPQFEEEYVAGKDYDPDRCPSADNLWLLRAFAVPALPIMSVNRVNACARPVDCFGKQKGRWPNLTHLIAISHG